MRAFGGINLHYINHHIWHLFTDVPFFSKANLAKSNLTNADFSKTVLFNTNLSASDLSFSRLINSNFQNADLSNCAIHGISAWKLNLEGAIPSNLTITAKDEPNITVENLEVAQFVYLLLSNEKIRDIIDTIGKKAVLILGRFTKERKAVIDAIRDELRKHDFLPILFDFDKPASRDLTETISTLAHLARFIIADITDANSIPQELQAVIPNLPSVPVQPLLLGSATEYGMFEHFRRYPWVLEMCRYHDPDELIQSIQSKVITPAEEKAKALMAGEHN